MLKRILASLFIIIMVMAGLVFQVETRTTGTTMSKETNVVDEIKSKYDHEVIIDVYQKNGEIENYFATYYVGNVLGVDIFAADKYDAEGNYEGHTRGESRREALELQWQFMNDIKPWGACLLFF